MCARCALCCLSQNAGGWLIQEHAWFMYTDLAQALREPFPPVLLAHSNATVIAEQYVGSHPLAALLLLGTPSQDLSSALAAAGAAEPNYEPFFPVALMAEEGQAVNERLQREYEEYVDVLRSGAPGTLLGSEGWEQVSKWVEENT